MHIQHLQNRRWSVLFKICVLSAMHVIKVNCEYTKQKVFGYEFLTYSEANWYFIHCMHLASRFSCSSMYVYILCVNKNNLNNAILFNFLEYFVICAIYCNWEIWQCAMSRRTKPEVAKPESEEVSAESEEDQEPVVAKVQGK